MAKNKEKTKTKKKKQEKKAPKKAGEIKKGLKIENLEQALDELEEPIDSEEFQQFINPQDTSINFPSSFQITAPVIDTHKTPQRKISFETALEQNIPSFSSSQTTNEQEETTVRYAPSSAGDRYARRAEQEESRNYAPLVIAPDRKIIRREKVQRAEMINPLQQMGLSRHFDTEPEKIETQRIEKERENPFEKDVREKYKKVNI